MHFLQFKLCDVFLFLHFKVITDSFKSLWSCKDKSVTCHPLVHPLGCIFGGWDARSNPGSRHWFTALTWTTQFLSSFIPHSPVCVGVLSCSSVQSSHSVMSDSLRPHGLQHTRPPCPSPTPRAYSNSCPSCRWCHPTISSSVLPFSSHLQSSPASGAFPTSQFFTSGG